VTARTDEPVARVAQNEAMAFEALLSVLAIDDGNVADHGVLVPEVLDLRSPGRGLGDLAHIKLRRSGGANVRRSALRVVLFVRAIMGIDTRPG
jgi:hypothetical protein